MMLIVGLKGMQFFNSSVPQNTLKIFQRVTNFTIFKDILRCEDTGIIKNYSKGELTESYKKSSSNTKAKPDEINFQDRLIKWAIHNNISYFTFSSLLKVLRERGIEDLPVNSRTLLKAREGAIKDSTVPPGIYSHFGLEKNLTNLISNLMDRDLFHGTDIDVSIFIDNLLLSKFTQQGLWVILGSIGGFTQNIFFVGVYHGCSRPKNSNLFLSEFVSEAKYLCSKGLEINGITYNVKIKRLICDAPAKAFVLNIKDFMGYASCTKCNTIGQFKSKKVCFPETSSPRTDEDFERNEIYQSHKTKLLEIPGFGIVSNVVLDYMHLVCLGVVQKILSIWLTNDKYWNCENSASDMIKASGSNNPCEFQKKAKSFKLFTRWGGSEFRQFLLYHCPVVLKNNLKKEYFDHFLHLHVACRLLCAEATPENIDCARKLLSSFVKDYKKLYVGEQITHNFHGLYHLADECASHGTLDSFSAFPFEKFLLHLRNTMKKSKKKSIPKTILKESYDTIFAKALSKLTKNHYKVGKKLKTIENNDSKNCSHCEKLTMKNFEIIPGSNGDKYVLLKNNKIIEVTSVLEKKEKSNKTHFIAGREFSSVSNFHSEPFKSLQLNTFSVGELLDVTDLWPVDMIDKKCLKIPAGNKETVMIALLDENF